MHVCLCQSLKSKIHRCMCREAWGQRNVGARDRDLESLLKHRVLLFLTRLPPFANCPPPPPTPCPSEIFLDLLIPSQLSFSP